ncbi:hypothetical protein [Fimbriiglobus ruber]|uniref:hypothetical protein n=1 Tax=Fimbriiglobus ruber TaxID=1908690 RepID=UPI00117B43AD|nr:hypothetical protein [Fimbriiglobus ruber]
MSRSGPSSQHCERGDVRPPRQTRPSDLPDDRRADWLTRLAAGDAWAAFEADLNRHTIRVDHLPTTRVRIDTTTANSYADVVSDRGLLPFGHSKDDPTRPQLKIAAAVLDPLGMPVVTAVLPGNTADDPVYLPTIRSAQQAVGMGGRMYVGDCKMGPWGRGRSWPRTPTSPCAHGPTCRSGGPSGPTCCGPCGTGLGSCAGSSARDRPEPRPSWSPEGFGRRPVDRPGRRAGRAVGRAAVAGAVPGVRRGPGGGIGAAVGEGRGGDPRVAGLEARQEAVVGDRVSGRGGGRGGA